jgi:hypothetical protein
VIHGTDENLGLALFAAAPLLLLGVAPGVSARGAAIPLAWV